MNHLGHLFLSGYHPDLLLGNFIGDFIRSKDFLILPASVANGVKLHRHIDYFTDRHPQFRNGVERLRPGHHKYSPVVLDILYDHLLAVHWSVFSMDTSLEDFAGWVYRVLESQTHTFDDRVNQHIRNLLKYKYLSGYRTKRGLDEVLYRMEARAKFPSNFKEARKHLYTDWDEFVGEFLKFMPDIREFARNKIEKMEGAK